MDRIKSRIAIFLALNFVVPFLFLLFALNISFAESTQDDLKQVYGPPSPEGSEEEGLAQAKELEQKLILERKKLEEVKSEPKPEPVQPAAGKEEMVRLASEAVTEELLKAQKFEKRHYGMTLQDLSTRWNAFREKIQLPNSPAEYKKLSKEEKKLVNTKVKVERAQAKERMPIVDRGYFNEVITRDVIISQENFARGEVKTLQEAVERALDVSLEMKLAREKEKAGKWRTRKAFRDLFTELTFEMIYKNGELSGSAQTGTAFKSNKQRLNFKQPVFHGGNLWNTFREEAAQAKADREELAKTRADLVLEAATAYLDYARAETLFKDKSEFADKAHKFKIQNEEKKKIGAVSEIEYLNTDSLIGEINADMETAHQELALAEVDLAKFLDLSRDQKYRVESIDVLKDKILASSGGQAEITIAPKIEESGDIQQEIKNFIDLAYKNRPDLRLEEFKLMASRYKTKAAYGKFLPEADLIMELGELAEAFKLIDKTPIYHTEWKIGVEVSQSFLGSTGKYSYDTTRTAPSVSEFQGGAGTRVKQNKFTFSLFDALQQYVDVKEARTAMLEQMVELQEKESEVIKEVKETYYGYHKSLIQLDSAIKKLAHRERVAKLKSYQLEKNQIQLSEYLQAEKDWIDAKNQYAEAVAQYYKTRIELNRAIGAKDLLQVDGFPFTRKEREKI